MMNTHIEEAEHGEESTSPLRRSIKTLDFAKLFHESKNGEQAKRQSVSYAENRSENHSHDSGDFLYMASKKRSWRRSLSTVNNQVSRHLDGSSDDFEEPTKPIHDENEELSLSIIDREISEWQHTCRTGRPLWWLPESRYNRAKNLDPWIHDEPNPRAWFKEIETGPNSVYSNTRRTVSESQLSSPEAPDELAHMIAIQLLGSCFTLPLDNMVFVPSPSLSTFDDERHPSLPDPRMISSLRMHTHFRYSPCFGHEQRNSSPAQMLPALYDGTSPGLFFPPGIMSVHGPESGKYSSSSRQGRQRRSHDASDHSSTHNEGQSADLNSAAGAKEWCLRNGIKRFSKRGGKGQRSSSFETSQVGKGHSDDFRVTKHGFPKSNYRLQPVIRSEPHPVFVQPVKELVVKRWKTFRRRFEGSLHGALRSHASEETESGSDYGSPGMSSDARTRRRRAQERGDIHSSGVDGAQHCNTPVSQAQSPEESKAATPRLIDSAPPSPTLPFSDKLVATTGLVPAECTTKTEQNVSADAEGDQTEYRIKMPKAGLSVSGPPTVARRHQGRDRRSLLSEVHTPEDFAGDINSQGTTSAAPGGRSGLSAAGSMTTSPMDSPNFQGPVNPDSVCFAGSLAQLYQKEVLEGLNLWRPRLSRASTSGTQVFSPSDDGVEVNQLPVGPEMNQWDSKGKTREQSFL